MTGKNILVVAELGPDKTPRKATLTSIEFARAAAARTGGDVRVLVVGEGIAGAAQSLAAYAAKVIVADAPVLKAPLAETYAQVAAQAFVAQEAAILVMAATSHGKDVAPRAAANLGAGMASDVIGFSGPSGLGLKRPIQAGNIIVDVEIATERKVITTRPTEFNAASAGPAAGEIVAFNVAISAPKTTYVGFASVASERPELTDARIVVSGGRGLKEAGNFPKILEPLADKLGAALGATRAVVDAGWVPNDMQVGQTGKVVAPDLYLAIGISGAIQHVAGMKGSKTIVAINKDGDEPIFQVADYGLVQDLFTAVPELLAKL
jgi:electron transfer flavoprotein alpha subunit